MTAREVARRVLDRVTSQAAWATLALDGELARAGLEERDRRLAAEIVYGVLRQRMRLDRAIAAHAEIKRTPPKVLTALRVAAYQLLFLDRVPAYAAVDDAVKAVRALHGQKLSGFTNAVLRKLGAQKEPPLPPGDIPLATSTPAWIIDELIAIDPAHAAERAGALNEPAPLIGRTNTLRITREALLELLGDAATPVGTAGIRLDGDPARMPTFRDGLWTVQDLGAQRVAELAVAMPRPKRVLDACAGVGGKSTHLAELLGDTGTIDAADQSKTKLQLLTETAARLRLHSINPIACDLTDPAAPLAAAYDLILLDAPCSGLGVLRRHPDAKWRVKPDDVPRVAIVQRALLESLIQRLAPGGTLVYSVCTFTRAEGPDQIRDLVARHPELVVEHEERTWPPDGDAFYLAKLRRP
jgi:16S rRNA (cytosine967-C5)-methyltransferase